jgi:hypothetical protein
MQQIRQLLRINGDIICFQWPPLTNGQGFVNSVLSIRKAGRFNHFIFVVVFERLASYKNSAQLMLSKPRLHLIAKALLDTLWIAKGSYDHAAVAMKPNFYESSLTH